MRYLTLILSLLILLTGITACSKNKQLNKKAQSKLSAGDYDSAFYLAAESLRLKPDYDKAQNTLQQAYMLAAQHHWDRISQLNSSSQEDRWIEIVKEYEALQFISHTISKLPPLRNPESGEPIVFDLADYSPELDSAKKNAAEYYYQKGIYQSKMDLSRSSQKQAAGYFQTAMSYVADYKDCLSLYEAARQKAITRIAVVAFEDKSGAHRSYGSLSDILTDSVISRILQDSSKSEFLEIITRSQMDQVIEEQRLSASGLIDESSAVSIGALLGAHEILSGKILQLNYIPPRTIVHESIETVSIEIEEEGSDSIEKEISCRFQKKTKTASLQILASYSIVDVASGKINTQESFSVTEEFSDSWGQILSGDSRVLSSAQKELANRSEIQAPSPQSMVNNAMDRLSHELVNHFFHYLK